MAITEEELDAIAVLLSAPDEKGAGYATLRTRFPHLSLTRCEASDLVEAPYRTAGLYDLHLIDTSDHCVCITNDLRRAGGLALALRRASA